MTDAPGWIDAKYITWHTAMLKVSKEGVGKNEDLEMKGEKDGSG